MANEYLVNKVDLEAVADKLREMSGTEEKILFPQGYEERIGDVYEAGKQAEYNAFWDIAQNYGDAAGVNYYYKFCYADMWNDENFNPKHDLICSETTTGAQQLFRLNTNITDTKKPIKVLGTNAGGMFYNATNLVTIRKLIVHKNVSFGTTFNWCSSLENIVVEGEIGKEIDIQYSPKLTKASIISLINALSTTTNEISIIFSKTAVNNAFETGTGSADGSTSAEWLALIATKTNWTISLV